MKSETILINTGRGGLVNESDLVYALDNHQIKHAILDVLTEEPPTDKNHPLINNSKCTISPHIAWAGLNARKKLLEGIAENIKNWIDGKWTNQVVE